MAEQNHLGTFGRGHYEEHFCEIILNMDWLVVQEEMFKIFLIWSSGSYLVLWSETI